MVASGCERHLQKNFLINFVWRNVSVRMFVRAANLITIGGRVLSLVSRIHSVAVAVSSPIHSYMKSIALWAIVVAFSGWPFKLQSDV